MTEVATVAEERRAWLNAKLEERGMTHAVYMDTVALFRVAEATWSERYWMAYQYAHNVRRVQSWEIARFARAYADVTDDNPMSMHRVWVLWESRSLAPDGMGTYHQIGPWRSVAV